MAELDGAELDGMDRLVIRQSRGKALLGVALAAAMLTACLWLISTGEPHSGKGFLARYVGTPMFAILTLIWLKTLLLPATLVLSREGLELRSFPGGFRLAWSQIAAAKVVNPWFVEYVAFTLAGGRKKVLPAAWSRGPAQMLAAVQEARTRWEGAPAAPTGQAAIVS